MLLSAFDSPARAAREGAGLPVAGADFCFIASKLRRGRPINRFRLEVAIAGLPLSDLGPPVPGRWPRGVSVGQGSGVVMRRGLILSIAACAVFGMFTSPVGAASPAPVTGGARQQTVDVTLVGSFNSLVIDRANQCSNHATCTLAVHMQAQISDLQFRDKGFRSFAGTPCPCTFGVVFPPAVVEISPRIRRRWAGRHLEDRAGTTHAHRHLRAVDLLWKSSSRRAEPHKIGTSVRARVYSATAPFAQVSSPALGVEIGTQPESRRFRATSSSSTSYPRVNHRAQGRGRPVGLHLGPERLGTTDQRSATPS